MLPHAPVDLFCCRFFFLFQSLLPFAIFPVCPICSFNKTCSLSALNYNDTGQTGLAAGDARAHTRAHTHTHTHTLWPLEWSQHTAYCTVLNVRLFLQYKRIDTETLCLTVLTGEAFTLTHGSQPEE